MTQATFNGSRQKVRPPATVTILSLLQFLAAIALIMVQLSKGMVDSTQDTSDLVGAVFAALAGAVLFGVTRSRGKIGWFINLAGALGAIVLGAVTYVLDSFPGVWAVGVGALWLVLLLLPPSREWFLGETKPANHSYSG